MSTVPIPPRKASIGVISPHESAISALPTRKSFRKRNQPTESLTRSHEQYSNDSISQSESHQQNATLRSRRHENELPETKPDPVVYDKDLPPIPPPIITTRLASKLPRSGKLWYKADSINSQSVTPTEINLKTPSSKSLASSNGNISADPSLQILFTPLTGESIHVAERTTSKNPTPESINKLPPTPAELRSRFFQMLQEQRAPSTLQRTLPKPVTKATTDSIYTTDSLYTNNSVYGDSTNSIYTTNSIHNGNAAQAESSTDTANSVYSFSSIFDAYSKSVSRKPTESSKTTSLHNSSPSSLHSPNWDDSSEIPSPIDDTYASKSLPARLGNKLLNNSQPFPIIPPRSQSKPIQPLPRPTSAVPSTPESSLVEEAETLFDSLHSQLHATPDSLASQLWGAKRESRAISITESLRQTATVEKLEELYRAVSDGSEATSRGEQIEVVEEGDAKYNMFRQHVLAELRKEAVVARKSVVPAGSGRRRESEVEGNDYDEVAFDEIIGYVMRYMEEVKRKGTSGTKETKEQFLARLRMVKRMLDGSGLFGSVAGTDDNFALKQMSVLSYGSVYSLDI